MVFNRFRWVFCQLEVLRNCLPQNVRRVLRELPKSLDETYERVLREIGKVNPHQAYRLLQCLTVATRPLRVDELAEVLALDFDGAEEGIPALNEAWRWDDQQQGVLSTCSSLIVVVDDDSSNTRVVQFAHFSVKEFLTSDRLANLKADISYFHIRLEPAHTVIAQACLAILLQSDYNKRAKSSSPLTDYAAQYWVDHAQFENVSLRVEDGMRRLFDPAKPHLTAWLKSYNIDEEWPSFAGGTVPSNYFGPPPEYTSECLYYAALCGFRDLTKHLIAEYPQHINAIVGLNETPLFAALRNSHIQVAELLHQHGAVTYSSYEGRTLLHAASEDGLTDVAQWLLNIGADANAQRDDHTTPLHLAAANGHLEIIRTLLVHGVDVNAAATRDNRTPLHEASKGGHVDIVRLLIQNGADASTDLQRLLLLASSSRSAETVQLFIQLGADVNARDGSHSTPLHLATSQKDAQTVRLLMQHGVDVDAQDQAHSTPLHLAMLSCNAEIVHLLTKHGADVHAQDGSHSTPLHLASSRGDDEIVQILIQNGADVHAQDQSHSTPLHLASSRGDDEIVQILIQNGADVHAQDQSYSTPLHLALSSWNARIVHLLIEHGADVNAQDKTHSTPLHLASSSSS